MLNDLSYMLEAIQLAKKGWYTTFPNPRVGCVIVKDNNVIARGWHQQAGEAHAEINALNQVKHQAQDCTAYVTLEPCSHFGKTPPCCDALIAAGVKRVVVAMTDPNPLVAGQGIGRLKDADIEVVSGILEAEARALNRGFIKRMADNRPFVRCKMAASLDGQTALVSGESQWITSPPARSDVQGLRAESAAILTGIGTVLADDPSMTVRESKYNLIKQPARIILDSQLKIPPTAKILKQPDRVYIFTSQNQLDCAKAKLLQQQGVSLYAVPLQSQGLDLAQILTKLAELQFNEILLESGKKLAGSMISAGLVDELVIYLAPKLMGSGGRAMFDLDGINTMADVKDLNIKDIRQVGKDLRLLVSLS
ncbi:MAG: bifunctional diaminohydroxyphosphoribosylaminopyrimidine deaminase/5-amino-6-(5-phosphoribosylamino)uracil reductase RibD [Pseudomonadota bacterium]